MANSFRELVVWQRAMQLTVAVYKLSQNFPREEMFGLTSQMRRSAVSVPSNIAEGHSRLNTAEFRQFLGIARGSNSELQTQLEIAKSLGYSTPDLIGTAEKLSHEVGKMLYSMVIATKQRPNARPADL
jgi:four helix bundle protein